MKKQVTLLLREFSKLKIKAAWSELNVKLPKLTGLLIITHRQIQMQTSLFVVSFVS